MSDFDFESIYKTYPNKEGKKAGMEKLKKTIKTQAEFDAFKAALSNYLELCRRLGRIPLYVKQWKTFVGSWTDYLDPGILPPEAPKDKSGKNLSQLERISKGQL